MLLWSFVVFYLVVCSKYFNGVYVLCLQKRQLAAQSGPFNLQNKIFCELFPDTVEVGWLDQR